MSRESWHWLRLLLALILPVAALGGSPRPACAPHLAFLGAQCVHWQAMVLPMQVPPARGNAFAQRDDAAALGMRIFYDNRFSRSGSGVSCASCHDPEHAFAETRPRSHTLREAARNAPDLLNAAWYSRAHFWDGKVDTLWSAPLFTFEQDEEMGSSRLHVAHVVATIYKSRYESVFGAMPDLSDARRFPQEGRPGDAAFDGMNAADRTTINRMYANVGKALEAYMRKLAAGRSPFDDFIAGSPTALTEPARQGMAAFGRLGCLRCHAGPTFSDEQFHALRLAPLAGRPPDSGRAAGLRFAATWIFQARGAFADAVNLGSAAYPPESASTADGAFRTPSLRNVAQSAPYGHDGSLATLADAIDAHAAVLPGRRAPSRHDVQDLEAFLRALSGRPPQRPWNYWPGG